MMGCAKSKAASAGNKESAIVVDPNKSTSDKTPPETPHLHEVGKTNSIVDRDLLDSVRSEVANSFRSSSDVEEDIANAVRLPSESLVHPDPA